MNSTQLKVLINMRKAIFFGSKLLGLRVLSALRETAPMALSTVVTIDDSNDGRSVLPLFRRYAEENSLNLVIAHSRQDVSAVIMREKPEIGFVCGWYWLFDRETLAALPLGLIGIHNSLLPAYRGGSPLVWAMINGDTQVGSSIFAFGEGMDDGNIYAQVTVDVGPDDHIANVLEQLESALVAKVGHLWRALLDGKASSTPQDHTQATYCGLRLPDDGQIRWEWPARRVHNFVRAQSAPYPGAFTRLDGQVISILRTKIFEGVYFGNPGQILRRDENIVLVSCGENTAVAVIEITKDGVKRLPTEVLTSIKMRLA